MTEVLESAAPKVPTIYFIDDSATMREVIKIAFRRESIRVIACHDAASAIAQFAENPPDAVITDVIMPGKDGYEVCQLVKKDANMAKTPVILMSGVVDRAVAEKAIAARADELIRKPFQPQELIARVKNLLNPQPQPTGMSESVKNGETRAAAGLSGMFATAENLAARPATAAAPAPPSQASPQRHARTNGGASNSLPAESSPASQAELQKLWLEIQRIEILVKKLQAELEAERQYVASLEAHVRKLQESR